MRLVKNSSLDPLYVIFEQHLYNFQDENVDRTTFIDNVLRDYFLYLRRKNISIPMSLEKVIGEELYNQVHEMLVKKTYGCLSLRDYQKEVQAKDKRRAKAKYAKLKKA